MTKLHRFFLDNQCYHVVTTTRDREPIFADPGCASILVQAIQFIRPRKAYVLAYAVMPDHLHALFIPREGYVISQVMQSVKGFTARDVNKKLHRRGPLWQRSFFDRMIRNERHLRETIAYVHQNPVIAGLAGDPDEYEYSSASQSEAVDLELFV